MSVRFSGFVLFFIFLLLVSNFIVLKETYVTYAIALVLVVIVSFYWLTVGKLSRRLLWFDLLPCFFIVAWVYGVYLGFLRGNPTDYVIRNFAGMFLYIIYFVIVLSNLDASRLAKVLFWAAITNALYSYAATAWVLFVDGRSYLQLLRMYYAPSLSVLGPFLALSLFSAVNSSPIVFSRAKSVCLFWFLLIPYAVLSFSKGYLASVLILVVLALCVIIFRLIRQHKISCSGAFFTCIAVLSTTVFLGNFWDELVLSFSISEVSNAVRSEQAPEIISELTIAGKGLGAVLDSGYSRNELAYGFELSYLSIIHKLGLIGALICLAYAICICIPLFHIFFRNENFYPWLAIGGMLFVVPSYGNPMIFSPVIVILHCCNMYFIRQLVINRN